MQNFDQRHLSLFLKNIYLFIYFFLFFFTLHRSRRGRVAVFKIKTVITVHSRCFSSELRLEKHASGRHVRFSPSVSGHMETKRNKLLTSDRQRCAGNCDCSRYHVHTGGCTFLSLPPSSPGHLIGSGEAGAHLSDDVLTSSSCKGGGGASKKLANRTLSFQYEL